MVKLQKRVTFANVVPCEGYYVLINHDETLACHNGFIDIRHLFSEYENRWMSDLIESHHMVTEKLAESNRWWWGGGACRLDARPLAPAMWEIKSLMFARAVCKWFEADPKRTQLTIVGEAADISVYLKDFLPKIEISIQPGNACEKKRTNRFLKFLGLVFIGLSAEASRVLRHHVFRRVPKISAKHMICWGYVSTLPYGENFRYFFTNTLDTLKDKQVGLVCLDIVPQQNRQSPKNGDRPVFALFDWCGLLDVIFGFFVEVLSLSQQLRASFSGHVCKIDGKSTHNFWNNYYWKMLDARGYFNSYVLYRAAKKIFVKNNINKVVYPYEEKGGEHTLLFACREAQVKATGYTVHPQSRFAMMMQDAQNSTCPKPDSYAYCGSAYVNFYSGWGNKAGVPMQVWGSNKSYKGYFSPYRGEKNPYIVLVTLNNVFELKLFHTWLQSEPRLTKGVEYHLRKYWNLKGSEYDLTAEAMLSEFDNIKLVGGTLKDNVSDADATMFCATSAGIEAANYGRIGIYINLNDLFFSEPCLNDVSPWLPVSVPKDLVNLFERLFVMDQNEIENLYEKQRAAAKEIFSPIDHKSIEEFFPEAVSSSL